MLRGFGISRTKATVATSFFTLGAPRQRRAFALAPSPVLRQADKNGAGQKSAVEEDREELERERRLREQFAQKIQQGMPQQSHGAPGGGGFQAGPGGFPFGANMNAPSSGMAHQRTPMEQFMRLTFFLLSFFMIMALGSLADRNSPAFTMQGLPWWELPITSAAYFLLLRALYPRKEQQKIKTDFEAACRENPRLTFDQFMAAAHPAMFEGYRTSQVEAVAAVAAVLATATDLKFTQSMVRAAGRSKDPRASTDDIVDTLRREYPQIF